MAICYLLIMAQPIVLTLATAWKIWISNTIVLPEKDTLQEKSNICLRKPVHVCQVCGTSGTESPTLSVEIKIWY